MAKIEDRAPASMATLNDDIGEEKRLAMYRLQVEIREADRLETLERMLKAETEVKSPLLEEH